MSRIGGRGGYIPREIWLRMTPQIAAADPQHSHLENPLSPLANRGFLTLDANRRFLSNLQEESSDSAISRCLTRKPCLGPKKNRSSLPQLWATIPPSTTTASTGHPTSPCRATGGSAGTSTPALVSGRPATTGLPCKCRTGIKSLSMAT